MEQGEKGKKKRFKFPSITNILTVILGVLIVYFGVSFALNLMDTNIGGEGLISSIVKIRSSSLGLIERSKLITETDELVNDIGNKNIQDSWIAISPCLSTKCHDLQYMAFIEQIVEEKNVEDGALILSLIQAWKNWDGDDLITFSKAVTEIDAELKTCPQNVYKKWQEIVVCNGICLNKDKLMFEIIELILEKEN